MGTTLSELQQLRFEHEQARSSTLAQLLRVLKFVTSHTRSGPFFWLLLPVTAPRAAIEFVAGSIEKVEGGAGENGSESERSWEEAQQQQHIRKKSVGRSLKD